MRACLQRVTRASVTVDGCICGEIGHGLLVLLGVAAGDDVARALQMADRVVGLRIFADEAGKMNRSVADVGGAVLAVSQFTLLADCRQGRRPSFTAAAPPDAAEALYEAFVAEVKRLGVTTATGRFRANMQVELVNDGPVTVLLEI